MKTTLSNKNYFKMKKLIITAALAIVLAGCTKEDTKSNQPPSDPCKEMLSNCSGSQNFLQLSSHQFDTFNVTVYLVGNTELLRQGNTRTIVKGNCMTFDVKLGRNYVLEVAGVKNTRPQTNYFYQLPNVQSCFVHKLEN